VEVAGSFESYWEARGKNLRQNMAKQRRKLEADGAAPVLEALRRPEQVAEGVRDYGALESASWKAEGGTAIHPDNAQGRFYRAMLEAFCARGLGCIYRYRFGEKVVAVDLCVESAEVQVILKTTYDSSNRALSPAFLMRQEAFRGVWEAGRIRRIEFFGKVMEWHTRWTDKARTLYHVNCYRWPFLPAVHGWIGRRRVAAVAGES
jgi:CelD/BcsL family acetyltransferase involved in cellulose biosynthesis